jgi:hypothetical protein
MKMDETEMYEASIKKFGIFLQSRVWIEECIEVGVVLLDKSVNPLDIIAKSHLECAKGMLKQMREPNYPHQFTAMPDIEKISEEIADVEIMLSQIKIAFKISDDRILAWKKEKLNRLEKRVSE